MRSSAWLAETERRRLGVIELGVGLAGLAIGAGAVALASGSVHHDSAAHHVLRIAGLRVAYPRANVAAAVLLPLALLGAVVLARAVRALAREVADTRALRRALPVVGAVPAEPREAARRAAPREAAPAALVVAGQRPLAFCLGWLRPRVYVSAGAVALLAPDELHAVIAHERQHAAARDPLRLAVARALREALFYLPVLRPLGARRETLTEVVADAAALRASGGDPTAIARALVAFEEGGAGLEPERVDHLLGQHPAWRLPVPALVAGLATLAAGIMALWLSARAASAGATLAFPGLSRQPCVLALALIGAAAALLALSARRAATR